MHSTDLTATDAGPRSASIDRMPAHWLMASLGKRVLRPGGRELTHWLITTLRLSQQDDVIEIAPGLGETARSILALEPRSYTGIERDSAAVVQATKSVSGGNNARVVHADASRIPLEREQASVVLGEAMLSMLPLSRKQAVLAEANRVLRPGGRYGIHEMALAREDMSAAEHANMEREMSAAIRVGVRIHTVSGWRQLLEDAGFNVRDVSLAPMRLLEPTRLIADEGVVGAARFLANTAMSPAAARRLWRVRSIFKRYEAHLTGIAMVAVKHH